MNFWCRLWPKFLGIFSNFTQISKMERGVFTIDTTNKKQCASRSNFWILKIAQGQFWPNFPALLGYEGYYIGNNPSEIKLWENLEKITRGPFQFQIWNGLTGIFSNFTRISEMERGVFTINTTHSQKSRGILNKLCLEFMYFVLRCTVGMTGRSLDIVSMNLSEENLTSPPLGIRHCTVSSTVFEVQLSSFYEIENLGCFLRITKKVSVWMTCNVGLDWNPLI